MGLRANLLVAYSSKPISQDNFYYPEEEKEERRATEFQRLVYGLSFFHGVVLERHRYGPTGWNGSYTFNMSDLRISLNQLRDILFKVSCTGTVFENHRKSLIQHCERSELRLHFEWTKVIKNVKNGPFWRVFENLKLAVKQCYQTGQF